MNKSRLLVVIVSLALMLVGAAYLLMPEWVLALTGEFAVDTNALVDVRATYGGVQLGLGFYMLYELWRGSSVRALMRLLAFAFATIGSIRLVAALASADASNLHTLVGLFELSLVLVVWFFYTPRGDGKSV